MPKEQVVRFGSDYIPGVTIWAASRDEVRVCSCVSYQLTVWPGFEGTKLTGFGVRPV